LGFQLRIEDGSYVQTLEVRAGALTVGRNPPEGLALTSPGLSARHAIFRQKGERVEVDALPTKIGVRLRGERVDHALLAANEMIQVGWARITVVEITPETAAEEAPFAAAPAAPAPGPQGLDDAPGAATALASTAAPARLELEEAPCPPPGARPYVPARAATETHAPQLRIRASAPAAHRLHATVPAADFVVISRQAVRVLPWWGISIALHALLLAVVLMLPKPPRWTESDSDSTIAVTLRNTTRFEAENVPVIETSRRAVDLARPDMAVPMDTHDSTLPVSPNPKGRDGTGAPRAEDTGIVFDDPAGGSPWAQPGGSSSIGVGSGVRFGTGVGSNLDETFGKDDAGRANAAAAGKLNGDPFTRSLVSGLRLRTTDRNVKVVSGDYDHGELVMTALGLGHGTIASDDLARNAPDQEIRAIFYNCTGRPASARTLENLERWVKEGGYLFTSDWGVENVVEKAFPGYVKSVRDGARLVMTPDETITFTIAPGKHQLLAGLPPEAETSRWWLEDSSILFSIVKPEAVEVLAVSADLERKHGSKFVAVTFPYGKGRVVHALGHMFQKEGNLRGAYAMQRLLLNFLYQAIKAQ
jgi:hypothetical protein